jgi:hypothetical protein
VRSERAIMACIRSASTGLCQLRPSSCSRPLPHLILPPSHPLALLPSFSPSKSTTHQRPIHRSKPRRRPLSADVKSLLAQPCHAPKFSIYPLLGQFRPRLIIRRLLLSYASFFPFLASLLYPTILYATYSTFPAMSGDSQYVAVRPRRPIFRTHRR